MFDRITSVSIWNHLTVSKQMQSCKQMSLNLFKNKVTAYKSFLL